jgi:hypothetical protein
MKNRKREICTSGTVRDEDGNILIYSARPHDGSAAHTGGRRTQTSKGGNRGRYGEAARQTLWGFGRRRSVAEVC